MINGALYLAFVLSLIGFIFQRLAYNAKCRECEFLYKLIRINTNVLQSITGLKGMADDGQ